MLCSRVNADPEAVHRQHMGDASVPEIPGCLEAGEGRENPAVEGDEAAAQVVGEMQTGGVGRRWSGSAGAGMDSR